MRTIILIITGGVAAYKSLLLIRQLKAAGYRVVPVMTESAKEFVTPLSVSALAEEAVRSTLFNLDEEAKMGHIELARSADLIVVAPATANFIAKLAHGIADDLASTLALASWDKLLIAPAMNVAMYENEATRFNLDLLASRGHHIIGPDEGAMACGEFGRGRMVEPENIFSFIEGHFQNGSLNGKRVVITSGPTHEPIDPVRYIANRSSGAQGSAIAQSLVDLGAEVVFITGPARASRPKGVSIVEVETAQEMYDAVHQALPADIFIGVAAVADYKVDNQANEKLKKTVNGISELNLVENPDILKSVAGMAKLVIGFSAETENLLEYAMAKRERKGCDWIIANNVSPETGIMGGDENEVHFISKDISEHWQRASKTEIATKLAQKISEHFK